jgi:hypothetical protein
VRRWIRRGSGFRVLESGCDLVRGPVSHARSFRPSTISGYLRLRCRHQSAATANTIAEVSSTSSRKLLKENPEVPIRS